MAINQVTDRIITEWMINTGKSQKEIQALAKKIRQEERLEKDLALIRKNLTSNTSKLSVAEKRHKKVIDDVTKSTKKEVAAMKQKHAAQMQTTSMFKKLNAGMILSTVKGHLYAAAISSITEKFGEYIENASKLSAAQNIYTGDIERARSATQGLASDLDLMQTRNRMQTLGVKLTDEQHAELLKSTVKLSDAMGIDLKHGLDSVTTALSRQSAMVFDNLGIIVDAEAAYEKWAEANGVLVEDMTAMQKKLAWQTAGIEQMSEKAAELPEKVKGIGIAAKQLGVDMGNTFTKLATRIDQTLGDTLDDLTNKLMFFKSGKMGGAIEEMIESDKLAKVNADLKAFELGIGEVNKELAGGGDIEESLFGKTAVIGRGKFKEGAEFTSMPYLSPAEIEQRAMAASAARKKAFGEARSEWDQQMKGIEDARLQHEKRVTAGVRAEFEEQLEGMRLMHEASNQRRADIVGIANEIDNMRMAQQGQLAQEIATTEKQSFSAKMREKAFGAVDQAKVDTIDAAIGSFSMLGEAMVQSAFAAEASGESFASSLGKIVKAQLKATAITATIRALEALALAAWGVATWQPQVVLGALKSAALYAATAAAAGVASSVIPGGGGGGGARASTPRVQTQERRPPTQFAQKREEARQPINIDLYVGDPSNPSSALIAKQQLQANLAMQQQSIFSEV